MRTVSVIIILSILLPLTLRLLVRYVRGDLGAKHSASEQNAAAPVHATAPDPVTAPAPAAPVKPAPIGNNVFVGESVAFTGTLPGMTRSQAIQAVQKNGGKAFETMPKGITLLVVGKNPGNDKIAKADARPSVRKISAADFFFMLNRPLCLEPDDFIAYIASI